MNTPIYLFQLEASNSPDNTNTGHVIGVYDNIDLLKNEIREYIGGMFSSSYLHVRKIQVNTFSASGTRQVVYDANTGDILPEWYEAHLYWKLK